MKPGGNDLKSLERTEFIFIRHGQTADNVAGILQGHRDTPLDETGRRQARLTAECLRGKTVDAIFSSDLLRAFETAQIIGEVMGVTPVSTCGLREWHLGELEGQYSKELWKSHFEIMNCFNEDMGDVPVPGGESRYTFEKRVAGCIEDIADKNIGKTVVIVTHSGTMHSIFKHIVGPLAFGNLQPMCSNVSVSKAFRLADGKWRLRSWNDICHLDTVRDSETF